MENFIKRWTSPDYPPSPVTEEALASAEDRLGSKFPRTYRHAVLRHGLPWPNIKILDRIVDLKSEMFDVSEFLSPNEIVENTFFWHEMGLPVELITFATDSGGNLFCFPESTSIPNPEDSPIVFFDHDFDSTETVAASFDGWMDAYCQLST